MRNKLIGLLAYVLCIVPPALVTLHYFPIWYRVNRVEMVVPGVAVFFLSLVAIPLFRWAWRMLRTPACWMPWALMLGLLWLVEPIIHEVQVIVFVGTAGNLLGAVLFKVARRGSR